MTQFQDRIADRAHGILTRSLIGSMSLRALCVKLGLVKAYTRDMLRESLQVDSRFTVQQQIVGLKDDSTS